MSLVGASAGITNLSECAIMEHLIVAEKSKLILQELILTQKEQAILPRERVGAAERALVNFSQRLAEPFVETVKT